MKSMDQEPISDHPKSNARGPKKHTLHKKHILSHLLPLLKSAEALDAAQEYPYQTTV